MKKLLFLFSVLFTVNLFSGCEKDKTEEDKVSLSEFVIQHDWKMYQGGGLVGNCQFKDGKVYLEWNDNVIGYPYTIYDDKSEILFWEVTYKVEWDIDNVYMKWTDPDGGTLEFKVD